MKEVRTLSRIGVSSRRLSFNRGGAAYAYIMWCDDCTHRMRERTKYSLTVYKSERCWDKDIDYKIHFTAYREFRDHLSRINPK